MNSRRFTAQTIAVTPPIIFSKEVAQNRPPHFLARTSLTTRNSFRADFRGWRLDEFSIFARPPPGGSTHPHPRGWRRRLTPALAAALCRSRCTPSRRAFNCARKVYKLVTQPREGGFYRDEIEIKESHSKHRKLDS